MYMCFAPRPSKMISLVVLGNTHGPDFGIATCSYWSNPKLLAVSTHYPKIANRGHQKGHPLIWIPSVPLNPPSEAGTQRLPDCAVMPRHRVTSRHFEPVSIWKRIRTPKMCHGRRAVRGWWDGTSRFMSFHVMIFMVFD